MARLSVHEILDVALRAGFSPDREEAVIATAIALAESGGDPHAHNPKPPDNSFGLWQINMIGALGPDRRQKLGLSRNEELFDHKLTPAPPTSSSSKQGSGLRLGARSRGLLGMSHTRTTWALLGRLQPSSRHPRSPSGLSQSRT
jgi:Lysozyme like domain